MATLTVFGEVYSCAHAQKGADFVRLLDENKDIVFFADGISDFTPYKLTGGNWEPPIAVVSPVVNAYASLSGAVVTLALSASVKVETGLEINFKAPCDCTAVDAIEVVGVNYTVVDPTGYCVTGKIGSWVAGAQISVVLDVENSLAYIQNTPLFRPKVGDILATTRTDLGDEWRLCNGASFSATELPDLAAVSPDQVSLLSRSRLGHYSADVGSGNSSFACNDTHQVLAYFSSEGTLTLAVSTDGFLTYTSFVPQTSAGANVFSNSSVTGLVIIRYVDGVWVLRAAGVGSSAYVYYSSDVVNPQSWTKGGNTGGFRQVFDIWKADNGVFFLAGVSYSSSKYAAAVWKATTIGGSWSQVASQAYASPVYGFARNGNTVAFNRELRNIGYITDVTASTATFSEYQISSAFSGSATAKPASGIYYHDGKWFFQSLVASNSVWYPVVYSTTDITSGGAWVETRSSTITVEVPYYPESILPLRGMYVLTNKLYDTDAECLWVCMPSLTDATTWYTTDMRFEGSGKTVGYQQTDNWDSPVVTDSCVFAAAGNAGLVVIPKYTLPLISADTYYNYIRVKE